MNWRGLALGLTLGSVAGTAGTKVYVFFPSLTRPSAIQSSLAEKCQGLDVTVFGRLADFQGQMSAAPPDGVVAPRAVLEQFAGYHLVLKGTLKGAQSEPLVLLSMGKPVDDAGLGRINLGVVGFLERSRLSSWVSGVLGAQPKLRNVTKIEDLLPLLTFQNADAVLVQESAAREIRSKSQAALVETRAKGRYELVGLAAKDDGAAKQLEGAFKALGPREKSMLGVDGWSR